MAEIAFIATNQMEIGIRSLGNVLKEAGHAVKYFNLSTDEKTYMLKYPPKVVNELSKHLKDCEVIGISVADIFFYRALNLAASLKGKNDNLKIVLGGIHAQLYPDVCMENDIVDAVCIGEGLIDIANLIGYLTKTYDNPRIKDFWVRSKTRIIKNGRQRQIRAIDYLNNKALPIPDYSYDNYWMLETNSLMHMKDSGGAYSVSQHQVGHPSSVVVSFMHGCKNNCSYCNISAYKKMCKKYDNKSEAFVIKPNDRVKLELKEIKKNNPTMRFMCIMDNDFTARSVEEIKELMIWYKKHISVPFYCMVSPNTLTEEMLEAMIDGGLQELNVGIQACELTNKKLYNRHIKDELIEEMAKMVSKHSKSIHPFYDFIIFNPEETKEHITVTIELIKKLSIPFDLVPHYLTLAPEVPLFKRLRQAGLLSNVDTDTDKADYHKLDVGKYRGEPTFLHNMIIEWMGGLHDATYMGRIPRYVRDLKESESFADIRHLLSSAEDEMLSIDFLLSNLANITTNTIISINKRLTPILYSNHTKRFPNTLDTIIRANDEKTAQKQVVTKFKDDIRPLINFVKMFKKVTIHQMGPFLHYLPFYVCAAIFENEGVEIKYRKYTSDERVITDLCTHDKLSIIGDELHITLGEPLNQTELKDECKNIFEGFSFINRVPIWGIAIENNSTVSKLLSEVIDCDPYITEISNHYKSKLPLRTTDQLKNLTVCTYFEGSTIAKRVKKLIQHDGRIVHLTDELDMADLINARMADVAFVLFPWRAMHYLSKYKHCKSSIVFNDLTAPAELSSIQLIKESIAETDFNKLLVNVGEGLAKCMSEIVPIIYSITSQFQNSATIMAEEFIEYFKYHPEANDESEDGNNRYGQISPYDEQKLVEIGLAIINDSRIYSITGEPAWLTDEAICLWEAKQFQKRQNHEEDTENILKSLPYTFLRFGIDAARDRFMELKYTDLAFDFSVVFNTGCIRYQTHQDNTCKLNGSGCAKHKDYNQNETIKEQLLFIEKKYNNHFKKNEDVNGKGSFLNQGIDNLQAKKWTDFCKCPHGDLQSDLTMARNMVKIRRDSLKQILLAAGLKKTMKLVQFQAFVPCNDLLQLLSHYKIMTDDKSPNLLEVKAEVSNRGVQLNNDFGVTFSYIILCYKSIETHNFETLFASASFKTPTDLTKAYANVVALSSNDTPRTIFKQRHHGSFCVEHGTMKHHVDGKELFSMKLSSAQYYIIFSFRVCNLKDEIDI